MASRAELIISGVAKLELAEAERTKMENARAAEKAERQKLGTERIQQIERERIRQIWVSRGVLPLLEEIAENISGTVEISESDCKLRFSHGYVKVEIIPEYAVVQVDSWFGRKMKRVRNKNIGSLMINGSPVERDGAFDDLLMIALASPLYDRDCSYYWRDSL